MLLLIAMIRSIVNSFKVPDVDVVAALYLARCLEPGNDCHSITTRETPKRRMNETLFTRHRNTVEPMMLADNRKATLQVIHTDAVVVVDPPILRLAVEGSDTPKKVKVAQPGVLPFPPG